MADGLLGRTKHPRTFHLPWSLGASSDDKMMPDVSGFEGQDVVVTAKMDGECTTLLRDGFHARSVDSPAHPSRDWLWGLHARIGRDIPGNMRVCGENLYAVHSIRYARLPAHFLVHSVWEEGLCLPWDETLEWAELLGLKCVPTLWRGVWNEARVRACAVPALDGDPCEGYVVRIADGFERGEFQRVVGKYVRAGHVATNRHWMSRAVEVNGLAENRAEA